ncbi:MAG: WbuC family cupin fold metalloprotein [Aggregatilineales bacterium]
MSASMRVIDQAMLAELLRQAAESPRRRAIYRLHEHQEPVQRMINAIVPGSYVQPHKHENPDKVELFAVLQGQVACLQFTDTGVLDMVVTLDASGPIRVVDIPPRVYHSIVALQPSALIEIIQGPYHAASHKHFAAWAPPEHSPDAAVYLSQLEEQVRLRSSA